MLSEVLAGVLAVVTVGASGGADSGGPAVIYDYFGGISTTVGVPGIPGGSTSGGTQTVSTGSGVTCSYEPDVSNHSAGTPVWEAQSPHTGEAGSWYFKSCSDGTFTPVWLAANVPAPAGVPVLTSAQLAVQAVNYLPLPVPAPRHNPDESQGRPQTVVGLATWLWVDPGSFETLTQTTAAGPVSATVTATPVSTRWQSGSADAPDVTCLGSGRAYDPSRPASSQSSDCTTTYRRSSAGRPQTGPSVNDRFFVATVTTVWRVSWTGSGGTGGVLPDISRSSRFPLAVAELQAVNQ